MDPFSPSLQAALSRCMAAFVAARRSQQKDLEWLAALLLREGEEFALWAAEGDEKLMEAVRGGPTVVAATQAKGREEPTLSRPAPTLF